MKDNHQYFLIYYIETRYGYLYKEPEPWFNSSMVHQNCPGVTFHCSDTHVLHRYGSHLKNFGLRTAMILSTDNEAEATMLRLWENDIINQPQGKGRAPSLQMVLKDPDFDELKKLCEPLDEYRNGEYSRKADTKYTNVIQRNIERLTATITDLESMLSPEFMGQVDTFASQAYAEINRIRSTNRSQSSKAAVARKQLLNKLLSYAIYTKTPKLK